MIDLKAQLYWARVERWIAAALLLEVSILLNTQRDSANSLYYSRTLFLTVEFSNLQVIVRLKLVVNNAGSGFAHRVVDRNGGTLVPSVTRYVSDLNAMQ